MEVVKSKIYQKEDIKSIYNSKDIYDTFIKDLFLLKNIPEGYIKILNALVDIRDKDDQIIVNKYIKQNIADKIGLDSKSNINYISNAISCFYKNGLLINISRGVYKIDPMILIHSNSIRLDINYSQRGKEIKVKGE